jgi:hypothetical protein
MKKLLTALLVIISIAGCKKSSTCPCYLLDKYVGRYSGSDSLFTLSNPPNRAGFDASNEYYCSEGNHVFDGFYLGSYHGYSYYPSDTGTNDFGHPIYCH